MTFSHEPPLTRREARLREEARKRTGAAPAANQAPDVASEPVLEPESHVRDEHISALQTPVPAAFSRRAGRAERERLFTQSNPVITAEMQAAAEAEALAQAAAESGGDASDHQPQAPATPAIGDGHSRIDVASGQSRPLTRREMRERELRTTAAGPGRAETTQQSMAVPVDSVTFHGETVPLFSPPGDDAAPAGVPKFGSVPGLRGVDDAPEPLPVPDAVWAEPAEDEATAAPEDSGVDSDLLASFTSGSALTTSALVLPTIPVGDATRPFNNTGEILITGSIDLPRSLASRGYPSAQFENTELDSLFAGEDAEAPSDSSPVRASKAVSSHTSTHDVISVKKPVSHRLPVVLMVTAIVLAVGVAALAVVGVVTGVF